MSVFSQVRFNDLLVSASIEQCQGQKAVGLCSPLLVFSFDDGSGIGLRFPSPEKLAEFCKKHNFELEDGRNAD